MLKSILLGASPQQLRAHRAAHREQGWATCAEEPLTILCMSSGQLQPCHTGCVLTTCQSRSGALQGHICWFNFICSDSSLHILRELYNQSACCVGQSGDSFWVLTPDLKYWYSHMQNDVNIPDLIQEASCSLVLMFLGFSLFFSAESQGQTNSIFKDYLPGSSDVPQQNTPVEPSLWKQTSHTHNLPPGLEYLNQVLNLSEC